MHSSINTPQGNLASQQHIELNCQKCNRWVDMDLRLFNNDVAEGISIDCTKCHEPYRAYVEARGEVASRDVSSDLTPVVADLYKYILNNTGSTRADLVKSFSRSESYISKLLTEDTGKLWLAGVRKIADSHGYHIPSNV